ncbi:hypothetical protein RV134_40077 [Roseovarius sp. EC-HK134]|nr:hypothetical protein RV420_20004 [Roseovarius sp. EC-SD190]VVT34023.1 hypothetical protein RV134_40077 [Roseovarius sp. EC-HK134]
MMWVVHGPMSRRRIESIGHCGGVLGMGSARFYSYFFVPTLNNDTTQLLLIHTTKGKVSNGLTGEDDAT